MEEPYPLGTGLSHFNIILSDKEKAWCSMIAKQVLNTGDLESIQLGIELAFKRGRIAFLNDHASVDCGGGRK